MGVEREEARIQTCEDLLEIIVKREREYDPLSMDEVKEILFNTISDAQVALGEADGTCWTSQSYWTVRHHEELIALCEDETHAQTIAQNYPCHCKEGLSVQYESIVSQSELLNEID